MTAPDVTEPKVDPEQQLSEMIDHIVMMSSILSSLIEGSFRITGNQTTVSNKNACDIAYAAARLAADALCLSEAWIAAG